MTIDEEVIWLTTHSSLGYSTPVEYRQQWHRQMTLTPTGT